MLDLLDMLAKKGIARIVEKIMEYGILDWDRKLSWPVAAKLR